MPDLDAIEQGQKDAKTNTKAERAESNISDAPTRQDAIDAGHELAEANHKAEQKLNDELEDNDHELKNDTSKAAKVRTSKSQLDPTGEDPISTAEVTRAAVDGAKVEGGTSVSDEDAVERAHAPNSQTALPPTEDQSAAAKTETTEEANEGDDVVANAAAEADAKAKADSQNANDTVNKNSERTS